MYKKNVLNKFTKRLAMGISEWRILGNIYGGKRVNEPKIMEQYGMPSINGIVRAQGLRELEKNQLYICALDEKGEKASLSFLITR